jgi:Zn-dependent peptidase ImmA (M78 family)/DNA-binding XRE family transcriptional regulator
MTRSVEALVRPQLLAWARQSAGLELEVAAKKAGVKPDRLESWERGERRPTIKQLRTLGNIYKRPIAIFYLPEPPAGFQALRDFRRLPGTIVTTESPALRLQIRRAQDRRELALDLYQVVEGEPPSISLPATLSDDPEDLAGRIREFLGIRYEDQIGWSAGYEAFNRWRAALENAGALVFQATDVEVSEMRGFSVYGERLPAIVVNIKDSVRGRIFSILHELAHIVLRQGGLCNFRPEDVPMATTDEQRTEVFCNWVAGATLVPRRFLLREGIVSDKRRDTDWTDEDIRDLADRYGASSEVLLRRLLINGRISDAFYQTKVEEIRKEYAAAAGGGRGGFAPPHRIAIGSAGPLFVRLVLRSYYTDQITASDVADFLDVRLKHLGRIESEVMRSAS